MTRPRMLFVDDEPQVLDGLKDMLRTKRSEWEMDFVASGQEALRRLADAPYDVIVSDLRMPEMDGMTLLRTVQRQYPRTIRFVLSGNTELAQTLKTVPYAHQFLTKPCNPKVLRTALERTCNPPVLNQDEAVQRTIAGIVSLPSVPRLYWELSRAAQDPKVTFDAITAIVKQDTAVCAKIIHLVNSVFFGTIQKITDIEKAIRYLGINLVKNLVLSIELFSSFERPRRVRPALLADLQLHSVRVANLARQMFPDKERAEEAFVAGLLHDIGLLIQICHLPEQYAEVKAELTRTNRPIHHIERERFGFDHGQLGAYLLGVWGIPAGTVDAVARHASPMDHPHEGFQLADALYVSEQLVHQQFPYGESSFSEGEPSLDYVYLEGQGVGRDVMRWRELAKGVPDRV